MAGSPKDAARLSQDNLQERLVKKGLFVRALAAVFLAACGGDRAITGIETPTPPNAPNVPLFGGPILATGVDSVTGATIVTNKDDYAPGEIVHVTGHGWAPGETVNLHMTEEPDTHADIDTSIVADASGAFSLHYYGVQPLDLGVTFTLTATGATSGSVAVATFYDQRNTDAVLFTPASPFSPSASVSAAIRVLLNTGGGGATIWWATQWEILNASNVVVASSGCVNTPNHAANDPDELPGNKHQESLNFTAPSTPGNYTFHVRLYSTDNCGSDPNDPTTSNWPFSVVSQNTEPTVDAGSPYSVAEGTQLTLSPTVTDPDASDVLTYKWTVNTSGIDAGGTCTFVDNTVKNAQLTCTDDSQGAPAGKFTLTLEVKDGVGGHTLTDNADLTVTNATPTATAGGPYGGNVNASIALNGNGDDPGNNDDAGLTYAWTVNTFGNGTCSFTPNAAAKNASVSCTNPSAAAPGGVFKLSLNASDDDGATSVASLADLTITNQAPTSVPGGPYNGNEGSPITINGSGVDPDGGTVTFEWSVSTPKCTFVNANAASTNVTCTDHGDFTLTLKATDDEGAFTTNTTALNVANVAPTIGSHTLAVAPVNEGSSIAFSVGNVTDPSSDDQTAGFTYSFKCGSAAYSEFDASNTVNCNAGDGPGSIEISGRAKDKDGGISDAVSSTFTVNNVKPTITAVTTNSPVNEGSDATLTVTTVTDPWAADLVGAAEYSFACDGTAYGAWVPSSSVNCPTTDGPATLTIGVKVRDKDHAESDAVTENVTVQNVAPSATFNTPSSPVNEGSSFNLSLTSPSDPSSVDAAAGFTYAFDCGDGTGYGSFSSMSTTSCTTTDNGNRSVKAKIKDKDDGVREYTGTVTVNNVDPTADFTAQTPVNEGSAFNLTLTNPNDVSSDDVAAGFTYAFDCGSGYGAFGASASASCLTTDNGLRSVGGKIRDKDGGISTYTGSVTVDNVAPTATFAAESPVVEGSPFDLSLTNPNDVSSADVSAGFTYAFDCGDGSGYGAFGASASTSCPTTDNGIRNVGAKIQDKDGGVSTYTGTVTVTNALPVIGTISGAPSDPVPAGTVVTLNWNFTDPGSDTWTCSIQWDSEALYSSATYTDPKNCSATKTLAAGLYTVTVKVTDDDAGAGTKTLEAYIVVYDPNGGFVTGGGWIMSPVNAYLEDLSLTGKANFGFVSKYQPGKNLPQGNTEFQFHAGNLNFKSTSYEWLVVAGTRAQFKGDGTINGVPGYGFLLTGIDETQDKFRIKIVRKSDGIVVYDNQRGQQEDSAAGTSLGGGSIVIHTKK
jgi:hypothetical protein